MTEERVLLITGASSGIGEATARAAARVGFRLVLAARRAERLTALVEEVGADRALAVRCDVTDPQHWKTILLTNVYGVALTLRASLEALAATRGHVLITGSVAGRRTIAGSMYGASKWAVAGIGYNLREELRGSGIRVTLIEPGVVDTPFFDHPKPEGLRPADVARTVVFALQQPPGVDLHELVVLPTPPLSQR